MGFSASPRAVDKFTLNLQASGSGRVLDSHGTSWSRGGDARRQEGGSPATSAEMDTAIQDAS